MGFIKLTRFFRPDRITPRGFPTSGAGESYFRSLPFFLVTRVYRKSALVVQTVFPSMRTRIVIGAAVPALHSRPTARVATMPRR